MCGKLLSITQQTLKIKSLMSFKWKKKYYQPKL